MWRFWANFVIEYAKSANRNDEINTFSPIPASGSELPSCGLEELAELSSKPEGIEADSLLLSASDSGELDSVEASSPPSTSEEALFSESELSVSVWLLVEPPLPTSLLSSRRPLINLTSKNATITTITIPSNKRSTPATLYLACFSSIVFSLSFNNTLGIFIVQR